MLPDDITTELTRLCTAHLGAETGPRVAALARNGFTLSPVDDGAGASGRFRFGGPALLEPGTPWPEFEGTPLTLLAVVDTDALRPWLDAPLPAGAGLLNVFYLGYESALADDVAASRQAHFEAPMDWRVVPADPATAVEAAPPAAGVVLPARPVRADPVVALPDSTGSHLAPARHEENTAEVWEAFERLLDRLPDGTGEDGALAGIRNLPESGDDGHRAFGWPWAMQGMPVPVETRVHLLQLDTDPAWTWADCGMVTFEIPADALRAGDFSQVDCTMESC
jgi:hypothetical protein